MLRLRDLALSEDLDAFNVDNHTWPGTLFLRERAAASPPELRTTMVGAELGGRPAGFLLVVGLPLRPGGRCFGNLYVLPKARRQGVATALRARMLDVVKKCNMPGIMVSAHDDPVTLEIARHWGYPIVGRHYESELDLTSLDDAAADAAVAGSAQAGVELSLLNNGDALDKRALRAVYPFFVNRFREAPDASPTSGDMPFPVFAGFITEPWRLVLARRQGELVGVTGVAPRDPETANTIFTGVHPDHRSLGIALALKARHAQVLRSRGYRRILTSNMDVNIPILAANDRLGFRRLHSYLDVQVDPAAT